MMSSTHSSSILRRRAVLPALIALLLAGPGWAGETCVLSLNADGTANNGGAVASADANAFACGVDSDAVGVNSTAVGASSTAAGDNSTSVGAGSQALGAQATAVGAFSRAAGIGSTALGFRSQALGASSVALGASSAATGQQAIAIGEQSRSQGAFSIAIGSFTDGNGDGVVTFDIDRDPAVDADGDGNPVNDFTDSSEVTNAFGVRALALGSNAQAAGDGSTAVGAFAQSLGLGSVALGESALAQGELSLALGRGSTALGGNSTAVGAFNIATGLQSTAVGAGSRASEDSAAFGFGALAFDPRSTVLGLQSITSDGDSSTVIGFRARTKNDGSVALGGAFDRDNNNAINTDEQTLATGRFATALGSGAQATGSVNATATGWLANASADHTTSVGANSAASNINSTAVGRAAKANADNSVALGTGSIADRANTMSVGTAGAERQIVNVADGTQATDAANLRQLQAGDAATLQAANDFTRAQVGNAAAQAVGAANAHTDQQVALVRTDAAAGDAATLQAAKDNAAAGDAVVLQTANANAAAGDAATLQAANAFTTQNIQQLAGLDFSGLGQRLEDFTLAMDGFDQRLDGVDRRISRNGAMSSAMSQMAINAAGTRSARGRLAVGLGLQDGQGAGSIGYARLIGETMSFSVGAAFAGSENTAGFGFGFDL